MKTYTDLIFNKKNVKLFYFSTFFVYCLSIEQGKGDSTFFPDDAQATEDIAKNNSVAIEEWAELTPPKKDIAEIPSQRKPEIKEAKLPEPQPITSGKHEEIQKQDTASNVAIETMTQDANPSLPSPPEEQKSLQLTTVEPRPKVVPIHEKENGVSSSKTQKNEPIVAYSEVAKNRVPLGILEPGQTIQNQKWYIYASAIRGLKTPSDKIQIVSMEGGTPYRGEEIKDLLIENGIEAEKIQLIQAKGEPDQRGITYIFGGK